MKGRSKKFKVPHFRPFWSSRPSRDLPSVPPTERPTDSQSAPPTERPTESQSAPPTETPIDSHSTPPTGRPTNSQSKPPPELGPSDSGSGADIEGQAQNQPQKNVSIPWKAMRTALRALEKNSDGLPPLKAAVGLLVACLDLTIDVIHNREEYDKLALELAAMANDLEPHAKQLMERGEEGSVARIMKSINEELTQIKDKLERSKLKRAIDTSGDKDDIVNRYRKIDSLFRRLLSDITLRTHIEIRKLRDATDATLLRTLQPVHDARYNSAYSTAVNRRGCTASTREQILQTLRTWADDPTGAKVFWLNGMAGTGKTTILYTFCQWLEENSRLGGNFFCSRSSGSCRSLNKILPSLAYQVAHYSPAFRSQLCTILEDHQSPQTLNVGSQFKWVLETPLEKSTEAIPEGVVIVIDALDECESALETRLFLETLLKLVHRLPVKFVIASRPEPIIVTKMRSPGFRPSTIHLHDIEQSLVEADIRKYLEEALSSMSPAPSNDILDELARRSGKLFIYAATVARYVNPQGIMLNLSKRRLRAIMDISSPTSNLRYRDIDDLYTTILEAAFDANAYEVEELENTVVIVRTVICAMEPLTTEALSSLLVFEQEEVENILSRLQSVLHVQEGPTGLVSILHASFPDFMFDKCRSLRFHCDPRGFHAELSGFCFDVMNKELHFNICDLETSFLFDSDVPNLQQKIEENIPDALFYSSKYWGNHLVKSIFAEDIHIKLNRFLETHLLFWMEVLNVKRHITTGPKLLSNAQSWLKENACKVNDTKKKLNDAKEFVEAFSMGACSKSTPHIYISALPFCYKSNFVYENYWTKTQGLIRVNGSSLNEKPNRPIATWHMAYKVESLAFSHNGTTFATGLEDGVCIYDTDSGEIIAGPLKASSRRDFPDFYQLVTFSPDNTKLASASGFIILTRILIWDIQTGNLIAGPLEEHTGSITSLSFSPDSKMLVSGDEGKRIIIWDSATGNVISGPFQSTASVKAVGFTPDGFKIVTLSADHSICVWDAEKGTMLSGPVEAVGNEHGKLISTALSSDRSSIAMGFESGTVLILDTSTGAVVIGPLTCGSDIAFKLAFSHDDKKLFARYNEGFLVWDAQTGTPDTFLVTNLWPLDFSITPTPSGNKIISVTYIDRTKIEVWNTTSDDVVVASSLFTNGSIQACVSSLAYSPDSHAIAAGLNNGCVGLWDAQTGKEILCPFQAHNSDNHITSISFSPDGANLVTGFTQHSGHSNPLEPVRIWDAQTGKMIGELLIVWSVRHSIPSPAAPPSLTPPSSLSFKKYEDMSHDGGHGGNNSEEAKDDQHTNIIRIWDLRLGRTIGKPMHVHSRSEDMSIAFSPDDTILVSGAGSELIMWSVDTCKVIWRAKLEPAEESYVTSIAFSPDGTRFASGLSDGHLGQLRLWNATTREMIPFPWKLYSQCAITSITFLTDGKKVLTMAFRDRHIWLLDVETGDTLGYFDSPNKFDSVVVSPDCSQLSATFAYTDYCTIRVWEVENALATAQEMDEEDIRAEFDNEDRSDSTFYSPQSVKLAMSVTAIYHDNGWAKVDGRNIFWTSPDFHKSLCYAYNPLVIGPHGTTLMDYSNMDLCIGKKWVNCWLVQ
ncbi:WD40 repeat-like protein [Agrocybe pediades]|nr:WD40 repeat-like protein [Agrocybe pediades]